MTRCKQCQMDGHHKMSCTDESNQARKDRVTVPATIKEPIVEGAYYELKPGCYERENGTIVGPLGPIGAEYWTKHSSRLTRRVWITPTDPAEVVAELRKMALRRPIAHEKAWREAADLVAQKLGVES